MRHQEYEGPQFTAGLFFVAFFLWPFCAAFFVRHFVSARLFYLRRSYPLARQATAVVNASEMPAQLGLRGTSVRLALPHKRGIGIHHTRLITPFQPH